MKEYPGNSVNAHAAESTIAATEDVETERGEMYIVASFQRQWFGGSIPRARPRDASTRTVAAIGGSAQTALLAKL